MLTDLIEVTELYWFSISTQLGMQQNANVIGIYDSLSSVATIVIMGI